MLADGSGENASSLPSRTRLTVRLSTRDLKITIGDKAATLARRWQIRFPESRARTKLDPHPWTPRAEAPFLSLSRWGFVELSKWTTPSHELGLSIPGRCNLDGRLHSRSLRKPKAVASKACGPLLGRVVIPSVSWMSKRHSAISLPPSSGWEASVPLSLARSFASTFSIN